MSYKERNYQVVKSNDLIIHGYCDLSLQQLKILAYIISRISPSDKEFKESKLEVVRFCEICGMTLGGKTYDDIRTQMKKLTQYDSSVHIITDNTDNRCRWLEKVSFNKGVITYKFDDSIKPYLLSQTKDFTKYELAYAIALHSKYAFRLYELLKCVRYRELEDYSWHIGINEFRHLMSAEKYTTYQTLKTRVIVPAVNELNTWSEMNVSFSPEYNGKKVTSIMFKISTKDILLRAVVRSDIEKMLNN